MGIAFPGSLVNLWTARISQPHGPGHLIKCLACSVIPGTANDFKFTVVLYNHQMGMSAGYNQAHEGRLKVRVLNKVSRYMAFYMMHSNQRFFSSIGQCLGFRHSHQQSPHQSRSVGHTDGSDILKACLRLCQRPLYHVIHSLDMLPGSNLRNHASIYGMGCNLGRNYIGQHGPSVLHHGCSCLVAGTFYCQY